MQMFTMNEAAQFLAKELPHKTKQAWWSYLRWNPKKWRQQDGMHIQSRLIDVHNRRVKSICKLIQTARLLPKPA